MEMFILETGKMITLMDLVLTFTLMEKDTRDSYLKVKEAVKVFYTIQTALVMTASGKIIKNLEKDNKIILTEVYLLDNGQTIKKMETEQYLFRIKKLLKGGGTMTNLFKEKFKLRTIKETFTIVIEMEMEFIHFRMEVYIVGPSLMAKNLVTAFTITLMAIYMKGNLEMD